jgi:DNA-binding XRE family transcriptional regulator
MTPNKLVAFRKNMDKTQAGLAELIGLSLRAYQDLESGNSPIRPLHVLALERAAEKIAVAEKNPMLAPQNVRADAVQLTSLIRSDSAPTSNSPITVVCPSCGLQAEVFREGRTTEIAQLAQPELCKVATGDGVYSCPRLEVALKSAGYAPRPSGYQLVEIEVGRYGEVVARSTGHLTYATKESAEQDAERSARSLKAANGFNAEHGYWWGRDLRGVVYRFFVEAI